MKKYECCGKPYVPESSELLIYTSGEDKKPISVTVCRDDTEDVVSDKIRRAIDNNRSHWQPKP